MVSASFFLILSPPPTGALKCSEWKRKMNGFECFTKEDGQQGTQLNLTAYEMACKQMRMEGASEGSQLFSLSQALELDQIIHFPGNACNTFSELFADQPRQNLGLVMDPLVLSRGHQTNFLDIIHVPKEVLIKVKKSRQHLKFTTYIQFE
ncbi:hypothetical protein P7K49_014462 [Saguinus oedipus]|uniref:Sorting nexin protein WASP-binding domain-containing protein n=1 Tax=Saguinus oedipus TaxID=9490 RepID=A0ABQ9VLY4_SAGOE|nr:hypothetical protein P7K49_014462 [Saguinus oedipus]